METKLGFKNRFVKALENYKDIAKGRIEESDKDWTFFAALHPRQNEEFIRDMRNALSQGLFPADGKMSLDGMYQKWYAYIPTRPPAAIHCNATLYGTTVAKNQTPAPRLPTIIRVKAVDRSSFRCGSRLHQVAR